MKSKKSFFIKFIVLFVVVALAVGAVWFFLIRSDDSMVIVVGNGKYSFTYELDKNVTLKVDDYSALESNLPESPKKSGYKFDGYYFDSAYSIKVTKTNFTKYAKENQNVKIYIKWVKTESNDSSDTGNNDSNTSGTITNSILNFTKVDGGLSVKGLVNSSTKTIVIPNEIDGQPVISIGKDAFNGKGLTSVTLPETLTTILDRAFRDCSALSSITITKNVSSIANTSFYNCGLTSFTVDEENSIYSAVDGVLYNKDATTLICYPKNKTDTSLTLAEGVSIIGAYAFYKAAKLTQVELTNVTTIYGYAFKESKVEYVTKSSGTITVHKEAFRDCENLIQFALDAQINLYYKWNDKDNKAISVFQGCSKLKKIGTLKCEGGIESSLSGCSMLEELKILKESTNLSAEGFTTCSKLTKIVIVNNRGNEVGYSSGTTGYYSIDGVLFKVGLMSGNITYHELICYPQNKTDKTAYTLPSAVNRLSKNCFYKCKLAELTIPNDLSFWGGSYEMSLPRSPCTSSEFTKVTIGSGVKTIGIGAFYLCERLVTVEFESPCCVESIGHAAFYGCKQLQNIAIPESVQSIGYRAFAYCGSLKSLIIPNGVTELKCEAFYGCIMLESIVLPKTITTIGNRTTKQEPLEIIFHTYPTFGRCNVLKIFYMGTMREWEEIFVDESDFGGLPIPYQYSEEYSIAGYWHYGADDSIVYTPYS